MPAARVITKEKRKKTQPPVYKFSKRVVQVGVNESSWSEDAQNRGLAAAASSPVWLYGGGGSLHMLSQWDPPVNCGTIYLGTAVCNSPPQPWKTWRSLGFRAVVLSWDPVTRRQSSRWRFGNPRFLAPPPHLSSGCLRRPEDVTWPTPGKFLPWLFSKPCFVFYSRCLQIALPSWHGSVVLPPLCSKQPALSNKMSPHKMNRSGRLGVFQTSCRTLGVEQGSQRNDWLQKLCLTLRPLPSSDWMCDRSSKHSTLTFRL